MQQLSQPVFAQFVPFAARQQQFSPQLGPVEQSSAGSGSGSSGENKSSKSSKKTTNPKKKTSSGKRKYTPGEEEKNQTLPFFVSHSFDAGGNINNRVTYYFAVTDLDYVEQGGKLKTAKDGSIRGIESSLIGRELPSFWNNSDLDPVKDLSTEDQCFLLNAYIEEVVQEQQRKQPLERLLQLNFDPDTGSAEHKTAQKLVKRGSAHNLCRVIIWDQKHQQNVARGLLSNWLLKASGVKFARPANSSYDRSKLADRKRLTKLLEGCMAVCDNGWAKELPELVKLRDTLQAPDPDRSYATFLNSLDKNKSENNNSSSSSSHPNSTHQPQQPSNTNKLSNQQIATLKAWQAVFTSSVVHINEDPDDGIDEKAILARDMCRSLVEIFLHQQQWPEPETLAYLKRTQDWMIRVKKDRANNNNSSSSSSSSSTAATPMDTGNNKTHQDPDPQSMMDDDPSSTPPTQPLDWNLDDDDNKERVNKRRRLLDRSDSTSTVLPEDGNDAGDEKEQKEQPQASPVAAAVPLPEQEDKQEDKKDGAAEDNTCGMCKLATSASKGNRKRKRSPGNSSWIRCIGCDKWCHFECVNMTLGRSKGWSKCWKCPRCLVKAVEEARASSS